MVKAILADILDAFKKSFAFLAGFLIVSHIIVIMLSYYLKANYGDASATALQQPLLYLYRATLGITAILAKVGLVAAAVTLIAFWKEKAYRTQIIRTVIVASIYLLFTLSAWAVLTWLDPQKPNSSPSVPSAPVVSPDIFSPPPAQ